MQNTILLRNLTLDAHPPPSSSGLCWVQPGPGRCKGNVQMYIDLGICQLLLPLPPILMTAGIGNEIRECSWNQPSTPKAVLGGIICLMGRCRCVQNIYKRCGTILLRNLTLDEKCSHLPIPPTLLPAALVFSGSTLGLADAKEMFRCM